MNKDYDGDALIRWLGLVVLICAIAMIGTYFIRKDIAEVKTVCTQR